MRKLGIWGGPWLAAMLLVAGMGGLAARAARAQDRAVPWLGVMTQSIDDRLREGLDYEGEGVLVTQVVNNSPASRGGIRKGDILVSVNSRDFDSPTELSRVIRDMRVGQSASIILVREGHRRTVSVRLGERPGSVDRDMDQDDMRDLPDKTDHDDSMRGWPGPEGQTFVFPGAGRGRLGVRVENLKGDLGSYFDAPEDKGALIVEVLDGTPADKAGLKAGDVIVELGDRKVEDGEDLVSALRDRPKGAVSVTVLRKGARRSFEVQLEESPRSRFGRDMTIIRPRMEPGDRTEGRREIRRDDSGDQEELQQLREEVRELRRKLREMESKDNKRNDDQDDDDDQGDDGDNG